MDDSPKDPKIAGLPNYTASVSHDVAAFLKNLQRRGSLVSGTKAAMKSIYMTTACALIFMVSTLPVKAENVVQAWDTFVFPVFDTSGCAGEDGIARGRVHTVVSNLPNGNFQVHINAQGTVTGDLTGSEWLWRDTINDVLPIGTPQDLGVWTIQQRLKIIGRGSLPSFFLKIKFHVTIVNGELTASVSSFTTECKG